MNNRVLVKIEEREFTKTMNGAQEKKKFNVYYIEFEGVKIYLDLPQKLSTLLDMGGDLWITWDKVAKYVTSNKQLSWVVSPSKFNDKLFEYFFAKQMEMDFEGGEE